jgi:beta-lactamase class A
LTKRLIKATALYIKEGKATRISVWVRDLESKQWAASNENDRYAPASLLKMPLMIAYFKLAEIQPTLLTTQLVYTPSPLLNDSSQDFAPAKTLVEGQSYTVEQLIENMIINSDNNAAAMLLAHIDPDIFNNTLIDLGIKIPSKMGSDGGGYDFVTVKSYANIFRTLYSASYLTRDYSEQALELMASSSFKGIAEPLPAGTLVAHKFGEREVDNQDGTSQKRELHDCGIIYKGERPYSLCIMTEGKDFAQLLSIIKDISTIAYTNL